MTGEKRTCSWYWLVIRNENALCQSSGNSMANFSEEIWPCSPDGKYVFLESSSHKVRSTSLQCDIITGVKVVLYTYSAS